MEEEIELSKLAETFQQSENNQEVIIELEKNVESLSQSEKKSRSSKSLNEKIDQEKLIKYIRSAEKIFKSAKTLDIDQMSNDDLMKFFEFLIPDWKYRKAEKSNNKIIWKNEAITVLTKSNLISNMLSIMKNRDKSLFHHTAFSILIQFAHEIFESEESFDQFRFEADEILIKLKGISSEYMQYCLLLLIRIPLPEDFQLNLEFTPIEKDWMSLYENIGYGSFSKFVKLFEKFLSYEKNKFGSFYEVSFKPTARLFYFVATECEADFIYRLYPFVDNNACLVTSFHEQRHLWIFDVDNKHKNELEKVYELIIEYRIGRELKNLGLPCSILEDNIMVRL